MNTYVKIHQAAYLIHITVSRLFLNNLKKGNTCSKKTQKAQNFKKSKKTSYRLGENIYKSYLIKGLYVDYIKNSYNSVRQIIQFKNRQKI